MATVPLSPPSWVRLLMFFVALFVQSSTVTANDMEPSRLSRLPGATLVEGRQLPFLQDQPISAFRVYAFHADTLVPIPFQVDERDHRDRWVLDHGPRQKRDDHPGKFDENDVLVFMNRDLGRRGDQANLPREAMKWAEVHVGNEANPLGFVYVGVFASPPPLPHTQSSYARIDPEMDRIYAKRYALAFDAPLPTHLAFVDQIGDFGTNIIAGIRAAGEIHFLGGLFTLRRTDQDIESDLYGYRLGLVRVIRRARYWIPLPFGFRTSGRVDLIFYRDFVEVSARVKIKIPPRLVLADGELMAYFDFLDLSGARLLLEGVSPSDPINGQMTLTKHTLVRPSARWAALLLPNGHTLLLIARLEGALQQLDQHLYFKEATKGGNGFGGKPSFGFQFSRLNRLETGAHRLSIFAVLLENTTPAAIHSAAGLFLSPPEVSASPLQPQ